MQITPTNKNFVVIYETRQNGAIGEFSHSKTIVNIRESSFSDSAIYAKARDSFHSENLEVRFPVCIRELK